MKVFLSSTAVNLDAYRKIADDTIQRLKFDSVVMQRFGPLPGMPSEECERLARESDVVVCIVAHRYGSGITRREVEAAYDAGKDALVWILADDHPWTEKKETDLLADPSVFADPGKTEEVRQRVEALSNFKSWLRKTFTADTFTTPENLGRKIAVALANYVKGKTAPPVPQDKISIARLPVTSSELFGRETELQILDDAWANSNTNIVSFVAWGGVGKTALVNHWLKRRMARDNYRGAERVYGWSFFSQGTSERAASADLFIDQALRWFGDADPTSGSPWDKGERLARYIRQSRTLLILDGLEPLQHPPGPQEGRLKDAALQAFLVELAADQLGLCVISTRELVGDLVGFENGIVIQHSLEHLSPQAGAQILRSFNVKGDDQELEQATSELSGHAFSLTLLGSYLNEVLDSDIRRRKEIENLFDDTRYGEAAHSMIAAYERWLGEGMELAILRLLGLFDRPADLDSIIALRKPPVIRGLTEPLQGFKGKEWNRAVSKLRRIKLLAEESSNEPGMLDAHPLMREHFKQQLKRDRIAAWVEANRRLYEHLKTTAVKEFPDTIEEMSPLFAAVTHGCAAERHQEVLDEVFQRRIQRGNQPFSIRILGALGANLAALTGFFNSPWHEPVAKLREGSKSFLLGAVAYCLRSLGRLHEAAQPFQASFEQYVGRSDWINAARVANNLTELYVAIGNLPQALQFAVQAVELADRGKRGWDRCGLRTTLADTLHQIGRTEEALVTMSEAETILKEERPGQTLLYSLWGFRYCDLLLGEGKVAEVKERAAHSLKKAESSGDLLSLALDNLSLGRAELSPTEEKPVDLVRANEFFQNAVKGLRQAGDMTHLPRGLLGRSELYRTMGDYNQAERDLEEVARTATRSGMGLHLSDYHLEWARLRLAVDDKEKAWDHFETAKEMINRMGYHRRNKEVAELEAQLA